MKYFISLFLMSVLPLSQVQGVESAATFLAQTQPGLNTLSADLWARPRSGTSVASMPAVRESVKKLLSAPSGSKLVIRYPGGEEGSLWAEELHVWLISLGIDASLMDLRPGSSEPDQIELFIE